MATTQTTLACRSAGGLMARTCKAAHAAARFDDEASAAVHAWQQHRLPCIKLAEMEPDLESHRGVLPVASAQGACMLRIPEGDRCLGVPESQAAMDAPTVCVELGPPGMHPRAHDECVQKIRGRLHGARVCVHVAGQRMGRRRLCPPCQQSYGIAIKARRQSLSTWLVMRHAEGGWRRGGGGAF